EESFTLVVSSPHHCGNSSIKIKMAGIAPGHLHLSIYSRALRLARDLLAERGLRCGEARDRHAVGRARDVVETDLVAERHRGGIAAMLAADADLETGPGLATAGDTDLHEFTDAVAIDRDKRIDFENPLAE